MTNVYKFEVVVVDYDDLGEFGIVSLLQNPRTAYTVVPYVFNTVVAEIANVDDLGNRMLVKQKLPELFPQWLPITTAPKDGTRFLLWYAKEKQQYIVYYENLYERNADQTWDCVDVFLVVDAPCDHEYRTTIEEEELIGSYWQPLMELPI